ncbi:MAG: hypothetical protein AB1576_10915 [Bacillota bacterium]
MQEQRLKEISTSEVDLSLQLRQYLLEALTGPGQRHARDIFGVQR